MDKLSIQEQVALYKTNVNVVMMYLFASLCRHCLAYHLFVTRYEFLSCDQYLSYMHAQIFNSHHQSQCGKMGDYCDGELFKHHPLFQDDPCALQIRLYYDDLEMCNALGSKTKKHKLGKLTCLCSL